MNIKNRDTFIQNAKTYFGEKTEEFLDLLNEDCKTAFFLNEKKADREAKLTADDNLETGEPLRIGPNEEKTFIIKFVGEKNPDEEFLDDEIDRVYLGIRQIG